MIGPQCHCLNLAAAHWTKDAFEGNLQSTLDNIHEVMKWANMIKNHNEQNMLAGEQPNGSTICM